MKEKARIVFRRLFWFLAIVACFVIPTLLLLQEGTIVEQYLDVDYDDASGYSDCLITIVFDGTVDSATIIIYYYDNDNNFISFDYIDLEKVGAHTFEGKSNIYGNVQYFSIESCTVDNVVSSIALALVGPCFIVALAMFICSCRHRCKTYEIDGLNVLIYTGWSHHYMKLNGEIVDEYNASAIRVPIDLQCEHNGTMLRATISTSHKIKLKVNGKLYRR